MTVGLRFTPAPFAVAVTLAFALAACTRDAPPAPTASATRAHVATSTARPAQTPWSLPAIAGAQPDLAVAPDGALLLSWVEPSAGTHRLRLARWLGTRWSPASTVATAGSFGNAFDTPRVAQTQDGALWVTWLRAPPSGGYARDVVMSRSADGGASWSAPVAVNTDATATEHGFVSLWRAAPDAIGVAWLDGRAKQGGHPHGHEDSDAMQMLRSAVFDGRLQRHGETAIDTTVCDCCHTAVALATDGPVLAYRDRTRENVRDIHVAVLRDGAWRDTGAVHVDHWVMPGCPVNGPSVSAVGNRVTLTWFTAPDGVPSVLHAVSEDGGLHFGDATQLARDAGVLGRVAVAADARGAWSSWIAEVDGRQVLRAAHREWTSPKTQPPITLAPLSTHGNGAGMPRLVASHGATYAVWTDTVDGKQRLVGKRL
ncbi:sialidase family protein [Cognatilysobacter lacus]|uniref:Exo-alpha-sialidase n=1 Tax=Cognatilysobacter lacus TaxID=1643323 RepID=A0A5D8Z8N4_9GAMM|nr:sialidase family protein [Lysobacter lacus]TZF90482.1 exo-alpha-sialidase [Lysobacter lacus]